LGVIVSLLVGVFAVAVIPNFIRARSIRPGDSCIDRLLQINAAAQEFALENQKTNGETINFPNDLTPYLKLNEDGKIPPCPQGGIYSIKKVGDKPICSLGTIVTPAHVLP